MIVPAIYDPRRGDPRFVGAYEWAEPDARPPSGALPARVEVLVATGQMRRDAHGHLCLHVPRGTTSYGPDGDGYITAADRDLTAADALTLGMARLLPDV